MTLESHGINKETVISKEENTCVLEFFIPATCDFFDGHFPEIKLLPAVAQIDIVASLATKYFGLTGYLTTAKRIKFTSPVRPDSEVKLTMNFNTEKNSISYKLISKDEARAYSSGSFALEINK